MRVLVAGCGWMGTGLARALVARGDQVWGVRRDPARAEALRPLGVTPVSLDLTAPGAAHQVPEVEAIVACQSSGSDSPEAYRAAYVDSNRTLLAAAARLGVKRFLYTGSTGIFGQRDGSDVDERTPPAPAHATAEVLAEAERLVRGAAPLVPASVVRFSGLYGPGRFGLLDRVGRGHLALGPGDGAWMNFCHLDDAVAFLLSALARAEPGVVYHGSDAGPARRREVIEWVAARLGIPPTRADGPAAPGPDRRILSGWSRQALGVTLRYPSFREGLDQELERRR